MAKRIEEDYAINKLHDESLKKSFLDKYEIMARDLERARTGITDPLAQLKDPLSDVTRKERRTLLGVSILAFAAMRIGLVPQKISSFGLEFGTSHIESFYFVIGLIILYYLCAFVLYAFSDFIVWIIFLRDSASKKADFKPLEINSDSYRDLSLEKVRDAIDSINNAFKDIQKTSHGISRMARGASWSRATFEFAFPIIFAIYVLISAFVFQANLKNAINHKVINNSTDTVKQELIDTLNIK